MPLNSTQLFLKDALDQLPLPIAQQGVVTAYIAPPNPGDIVDPLLYIWGSTAEEKRATMPRPVADKRITYQVDMWLYYAEQADDPLADSLFPTVLDAITGKLRTIVMPVEITDTFTNVKSRIVSVGEHIRTDYAPAKTSADQALMIYMARLIVEVQEWVIG